MIASKRSQRRYGSPALLLGLCISLPVASEPSLQLSSLLDVSITRRGHADGKTLLSVDANGLSTSHLAFSGREPLATAWLAEFMLGAPFRPDVGEAGRFRGDPFWSRGAWVGIAQTNFNVRVGRQPTLSFLQAVRFNALADSMGFAPVLLHTFAGGQSPRSALFVPDGSSGSSISVGLTSGRSVQAAALLAPARRNASLTGQADSLAWGLVWERAPGTDGLGRVEHYQTGLEWRANRSWALTAQGLLTEDASSPVSRRTQTLQTGVAWRDGNRAARVSFAKFAIEQAGNSQIQRRTAALALIEALSARTDLYSVLSIDRLPTKPLTQTFSMGVIFRV